MSATSPPFLEDHKVYGLVVFPATAYLETVVAAAAEAYPGRACVLEDLEFSDALVLPDGRQRVVQLLLTPEGGDEAAFQFFSLKESAARESWRRHASGRVRLTTAREAAPSRHSLDEIRSRCIEEITGSAYYEAVRQRAAPRRRLPFCISRRRCASAFFSTSA